MNPLAIKCYLPGRRTQYVLYPSEDMSIELGAGADLCPRGFDSNVRVLFRLAGGQWFVTPLLGEVRAEDGNLLDGTCAVSFPCMLLAGSAALVLDCALDPRMPARVIQNPRAAAAVSEPAAEPAPVYTLPRVNQRARAEATRGMPQTRGAAAVAFAPPQPRVFEVPQPRVSGGQPAVALAERAPALGPRLEPSIVVQQAEEPARRELTETRVFDMKQLGIAQTTEETAKPSRQPFAVSALVTQLKAKPRIVAYAVLGLCLVALQIALRLHTQSERARAAEAARRVAATAALHPSADGSTGPATASAARSSSAVKRTELVAPLAAGEVPSARLAGELYATGDYRGALRQYRALSQQPEADPVFGVIAHALEQRLAHLGKP